MDFRDVLTRRRSVRTYADRPVARDVLERIADAAVVWAPSAGFSQGLRIVVVTDPDARARIATAAKEDELRFVAVVTMGHPTEAADTPSGGASVFTRRRKARGDVVRWERWEPHVPSASP